MRWRAGAGDSYPGGDAIGAGDAPIGEDDVWRFGVDVMLNKRCAIPRLDTSNSLYFLSLENIYTHILYINT